MASSDAVRLSPYLRRIEPVTDLSLSRVKLTY